VLLPIEPVDPRMAMRFISGKDYGNAHPNSESPALLGSTATQKNHDYLESVGLGNQISARYSFYSYSYV
jgi:hypothetical protein